MWMTISIQDEGIGMTQKELLGLFKPYQQAISRIRDQFGGNGLGLTIVSNIVSNMGGFLVLRSEKGACESLCA